MSKETITKIVIAIFCIAFFSFKARDIGSQFTGDENFYFESAKNMLESGDWLTPRYYSKPRFQKPILYYWFVAVSFKVFGVNWYAARFPSILLATFTVLLVYLIGQGLFQNRSFSIFSALILATTFKFFKYTRFAIPDMALLFFVTYSFYLLVKLLLIKKRDDRRPIRSLWMLFFLSLALGALIKGPIAIIIPLLSIIAFTLLSKERIPIKPGEAVLGIILFIAVTVPWFLAMFKLHGDNFVSQVWTREIAHRVGYFADTKVGTARFAEYLSTLFFYTPIIIIRFLPWSLFLPKGVFNTRSLAKHDSEARRTSLLLLSWFFTTLIFFALVGEKHSQYMLLLTPPFALIVGVNFSQGFKFTRERLKLPIILLLITALSFLLFLSNKELKLNNAILAGFASEISTYGLDETDRVAMGSHELIPQHLEAYLNRPVVKIGVKWYDPHDNEETNKLHLKGFFKPGSSSFCIIAREDFFRYASPDLKRRLKVIHKDFLWNRKIEITKDKLNLLLSGKIGPFLDSFKNEYYLVTNK